MASEPSSRPRGREATDSRKLERRDPRARNGCRLIVSTDTFWKALRGEALARDDWPRVIGRAEREGVASYLACLHGDQMPGSLEIRKRAAIQHMLHARLLAKVSSLLDAANIPWTLLKGLALAESVYDDALGRQLGDCDILIRPEDLSRTAERLIAAGFRRDHGHQEIFTSELGQIDLHTSLINVTRVPSRESAIEEFDERPETRQAEIAQCKVSVLADRTNAVYLARHLIHHHGLNGARWFLDLFQLLGKHPELAESVAGSSRHGRTTLGLLQYLLGFHGAGAVSLDYAGRLLATSLDDEIYTPGTRFLLTLRDIPGCRARARFLRETVFPSSDVMRRVGGASAGHAGIHHMRRLGQTALGWIRIVWRTSGRSY